MNLEPKSHLEGVVEGLGKLSDHLGESVRMCKKIRRVNEDGSLSVLDLSVSPRSALHKKFFLKKEAEEAITSDSGSDLPSINTEPEPMPSPNPEPKIARKDYDIVGD